MDFLNQTLFKIGDSSVTFLSLIAFAIIILITVILSVSIKTLLNKRIFPRYGMSHGIAKAYSRIVYYFIFVSGLLIALNSAGINISILFAGGAALLVGIGFGIQNIVNNFISGVILLIERPIKEGDFIEVNGVFGTVVSISARSTKILTNTNVTIIVPNSKFLEQNIVNRSYVDNTLIDIPLNVSYDADINKIETILLRIAGEHSLVLKDPKPSVSISDLDESFIKLKLWVCIYQNKMYAAVKADINRAIFEEFKKEKIDFAHPKRELVIAQGSKDLQM